jgi:hypothetical protein
MRAVRANADGAHWPKKKEILNKQHSIFNVQVRWS